MTKLSSLSIFFIVLVELLLGACSSTPATQREVSCAEQGLPSPSDTAITPTESKCSETADNTDVLVVSSSQGTEVIEPTVVGYEASQVNDPLEFINRPLFAFNNQLYHYVLIPVSRGYLHLVPAAVQSGVSNFFGNIREPVNSVNHLLQGRGKPAGSSLTRFVINSTIGLLGFFDPATTWFEIEKQKSHLNETLLHYGVGHGAFLVIPILGQSDLRNAFSTIAEGFASPIRYLAESPDSLYIQGYGNFHQIAPDAESYLKLRAESEDPYLFFRNTYMQSVLRNEQYKQD